MTYIPDLSIDAIDVPDDRARNFNTDAAVGLAASIAMQGLQHPIRVVRTGDRYQLIAGLHRLRAYEINQQTCIPAFVLDAISADVARLDEVMENLGRAELKGAGPLPSSVRAEAGLGAVVSRNQEGRQQERQERQGQNQRAKNALW